MFIQLTLLPLLLLQLSSISANRYGAYCSSDSDCDQHQKCTGRACRCNMDERRFWTGDICAVCVAGFIVTYDRCYKSFDDLKTWNDARAYCRARYADLFTWRNNNDEQFIRPVIQNWASSSIFVQLILTQFPKDKPYHAYLAWAGAMITSLNPHTTKWMDPDGIKLNSQSNEWCDPTTHAGYTLPKEPSSGTRNGTNSTEREECVTYNFGSSVTNLLCLADDYCSQKYPFICEMNAASMKLANSVLHGPDDQNINFEESPPPLPDPLPGGFGINFGTTNSPSALSANSGTSSMTNIIIFIGVGIILVVGAIVGYMCIKKKKKVPDDQIGKNEDASQGRSSFTSSIGNMMDE